MATTREHIEAARVHVRNLNIHLDRMASLDGSHNVPAMHQAIRELMCSATSLQQDMHPLHTRVAAQVRKAHWKADAGVKGVAQ